MSGPGSRPGQRPFRRRALGVRHARREPQTPSLRRHSQLLHALRDVLLHARFIDLFFIVLGAIGLGISVYFILNQPFRTQVRVAREHQAVLHEQRLQAAQEELRHQQTLQEQQQRAEQEERQHQ